MLMTIYDYKYISEAKSVQLFVVILITQFCSTDVLRCIHYSILHITHVILSWTSSLL